MNVYAVKVNHDDTVTVVSAAVVKETPHMFLVEMPGNFRDRCALGWSKRIYKTVAHTSARVALKSYMLRRQEDKAAAKAIIAQATKQIASANELLMHLPVGDPA